MLVVAYWYLQYLLQSNRGDNTYHPSRTVPQEVPTSSLLVVIFHCSRPFADGVQCQYLVFHVLVSTPNVLTSSAASLALRALSSISLMVELMSSCCCTRLLESAR